MFSSVACDNYCDSAFTSKSAYNEIEDGVDNADDDLGIDIPIGERIFGIPSFSKLTIFSNEMFEDSVHLYESQAQVIVGNSNIGYIQVFNKEAGIEFYAVQNKLPVIMLDSDGNQWDIFGYAVSGSRVGEHLSAPVSYRAYFWAWKDMFNKISLFTE